MKCETCNKELVFFHGMWVSVDDMLSFDDEERWGDAGWMRAWPHGLFAADACSFTEEPHIPLIKEENKPFKTWFDGKGRPEIVHLLTYHFQNEYNQRVSIMVFLNKNGRVVEKEYLEYMLVDNIKIMHFSFEELWRFICEYANECSVDMENLTEGLLG